MNISTFVKSAAVCAVMLASATAFAADIDANADANDIAIKGYDTVAYFTMDKPLMGSNKFTATYKNSIFQSFEGSEDWRFESDTGISMPLWGGLYSEIKLEYDYDNAPQGDNRSEDSAVKFGVGYSW